jgi:hypothetical protein
MPRDPYRNIWGSGGTSGIEACGGPHVLQFGRRFAPGSKTDPELNALHSETPGLMTKGRRSAYRPIAWALSVGLGWAMVGCGEGTTPPNPEPKPVATPAPAPASAKTGKRKADPREDMGLKELRESRAKKAGQP